MHEPRPGQGEGPEAAQPLHASAPGRLILVAGPSGAGKDTLIDAARSVFRHDPSVVFWERVITRDDQTGERHRVVSEAEFARIAEAGGFFLAWQAHGLHYGITAEIVGALEAGKTVIMNISRRAVGEALAKWPNTQVVLVTARPEVLRLRLQARGRETDAAIGQRLERAAQIQIPAADRVRVLDNSGALDDGIAAFTGIIGETAKPAAE
ncbi:MULTISPECIES: phosphonate metabolism protein/1,5-bisphosphokinase (PRPP-forming) PhnN [Rhodomicrobium]|uniref:phosphonate metabolism protein/1,5-bisphosphokinase (PRPP-forming) PhnN n=1 Tax=Rhodomicrobium TaxID=1068 RepID=UPI001AEC7900|nr:MULTISPECIES: phosphonate metabolism protein/1,5-bisphosphokinase (PRPP-forming) PhnN [Rhodomicrobium]